MTDQTLYNNTSVELTDQVRHYEKMLEATAQVNHLLLEIEDLDDALFQALKTIGNATKVDRVYVFENYKDIKTGKLYCNQKIEWAKDSVVPQIDNEELQEFPFEDLTPRWVNTLKVGKAVNGLVRSFPEGEREILEPQDIISLLVVPIIIRDTFWGFVGFDNCTNEYVWSEQDTAVLTSLASNIGLTIERKRTSEELERSYEQEKELNDLKNRFISMISHEIRTPVTAIVSSAELIKNHSERLTQEKREQLNDRIIRGADRIVSLLEQVLMVGKSEAGELRADYTSVDLEYMVTGLIDELKETTLQNHEIDLSFSLPTKGIEVDQNLMHHILTNLLENASKYSEKGSTITVAFKEFGDELNFMVRDEGIGVAEEDKNRIFEPFYRSKEVFEIEGTGLGLAIVSRAIEALKGTVTIESEQDKGTSLFVSIPLNIKN